MSQRLATPRIMGIVNASLDSVLGGVDAGGAAQLAAAMVVDGASVLDVGGQSLRTDRAEISVSEELDRLLPVLDAVRTACPDTTLSVDTYRAPVAAAAIDGGARIVNDPSGLCDEHLVDVVAEREVDLVVTNNRAQPKVRLGRSALADDPVTECLDRLAAGVERLAEAGVQPTRLLLDPGPDLGKSPDQTIAVLHATPGLRVQLRERFGPVRFLWALSRKDFIGALLRRRPAGRVAGTLGALAAVPFEEGDLVRVHDVAGAADFFAVRRAIIHGHEGSLELPVELRYDEPTQG